MHFSFPQQLKLGIYDEPGFEVVILGSSKIRL